MCSFVKVKITGRKTLEISKLGGEITVEEVT